MDDKESQALLLTIAYFFILAMPWIYSINRKLFDALAVMALVLLGLIAVMFIFFLVLYYFENLLDGK